jgi:tetratricopeptide (TPR) repeat protein
MSVAPGLWLVLLCSVIPAQDPKGLVLPYQESRQTWRLKRDVDEPDNPKPIEASARGELWLFRDRFEVRTDGLRTVYDFERDVLIQIDEQRRTWTEVSLLAQIVARQGEYQHRRRVAGLLQRVSKGTRMSADPFFVAARFGLTSGNTPEVITSERDGRIEARYHDQRIASWRLTDRELTADSRAWLERALWWRDCLHPTLRTLLVSGNRVPSQLNYTMYDLGMRTEVEIAFGPPRDVDHQPLALGGMTRAWNENDALERVAGTALAPHNPRTAPVPGRDSVSESARQAMEGNPLEAFLIVTEWSLQSGEADAVQQILGAKIADDPAVQRLLEATTNVTKDPEQAIAKLRSLDRSRLPHGYLLDTFLATAIAASGRHDEAVETMLAALQHNPTLVGSWKELGDSYHKRQDVDHAWLAWEVARKLSPNHKSLRSVLALEAKLAAEFQAFL